MSVKRTVSNSKVNNRVVYNYQKFGVARNNRILIFMFGFRTSEIEKNSTANLPYNINPSGLLGILTLLLEKNSNVGAS